MEDEFISLIRQAGDELGLGEAAEPWILLYTLTKICKPLALSVHRQNDESSVLRPQCARVRDCQGRGEQGLDLEPASELYRFGVICNQREFGIALCLSQDVMCTDPLDKLPQASLQLVHLPPHHCLQGM